MVRAGPLLIRCRFRLALSVGGVSHGIGPRPSRLHAPAWARDVPLLREQLESKLVIVLLIPQQLDLIGRAARVDPVSRAYIGSRIEVINQLLPYMDIDPVSRASSIVERDETRSRHAGVHREVLPRSFLHLQEASREHRSVEVVPGCLVLGRFYWDPALCLSSFVLRSGGFFGFRT